MFCSQWIRQWLVGPTLHSVLALLKCPRCWGLKHYVTCPSMSHGTLISVSACVAQVRAWGYHGGTPGFSMSHLCSGQVTFPETVDPVKWGNWTQHLWKTHWLWCSLRFQLFLTIHLMCCFWSSPWATFSPCKRSMWTSLVSFQISNPEGHYPGGQSPCCGPASCTGTFTHSQTQTDTRNTAVVASWLAF